jgi:hypothetical protein
VRLEGGDKEKSGGTGNEPITEVQLLKHVDRMQSGHIEKKMFTCVLSGRGNVGELE